MHFLLFPQCFYPVRKQEPISYTFRFSFQFGKVQNWLSNNGLNETCKINIYLEVIEEVSQSLLVLLEMWDSVWRLGCAQSPSVSDAMDVCHMWVDPFEYGCSSWNIWYKIKGFIHLYLDKGFIFTYSHITAKLNTIIYLYYFIPLLQGKSCYSIFIIKYQNEPVHEKTVPITFATSVDPHQPAHLCSLVRIHTVEVWENNLACLCNTSENISKLEPVIERSGIIWVYNNWKCNKGFFSLTVSNIIVHSVRNWI